MHGASKGLFGKILCWSGWQRCCKVF